MNLLDSALASRASEQMALLSALPSARRVVCACGCSRWWYEPPRVGRPRAYATNECFLKERNRRRRAADRRAA